MLRSVWWTVLDLRGDRGARRLHPARPIAAVPGVGGDTLAAGAAPAAMAATTDLAGNTLTAFAIALAAFGILAVGSVGAGIGLATGRRVLCAGGPSPLLIAGLVSCTAYLAVVGGLLIRTIV